MSTIPTRVLLLSILGAAGLARAQEGTPVAPDMPASLLTQLRAQIHDEPEPDGGTGLWTASRDWQAILHDGLCFHARPASVEQPSVPWRWRTIRLQVDGETVPRCRSIRPARGSASRAS